MKAKFPRLINQIERHCWSEL